ncbi:hypothetical protein [Kribbella solani]|uniref:Uncharacterized protein n=1 Tax=Kribbella solani TaxID=236067 RepID=A0A841DJ39_9ACTN|nr:hypothetical protein [Kribbella solani]MBB5978522.1 hypothetical protein [Kribbella solani]
MGTSGIWGGFCAPTFDGPVRDSRFDQYGSGTQLRRSCGIAGSATCNSVDISVAIGSARSPEAAAANAVQEREAGFQGQALDGHTDGGYAGSDVADLGRLPGARRKGAGRPRAGPAEELCRSVTASTTAANWTIPIDLRVASSTAPIGRPTSTTATFVICPTNRVASNLSYGAVTGSYWNIPATVSFNRAVVPEFVNHVSRATLSGLPGLASTGTYLHRLTDPALNKKNGDTAAGPGVKCPTRRAAGRVVSAAASSTEPRTSPPGAP